MRICFKDLVLFLSIMLLFLGDGMLQPEMVLIFEVLILLLIGEKIILRKKFLLVMLCILIHGLINIVLKNDTFLLLSKQIVGITISFVFFDTIINEDNMEKAIKIYFAFSTAIAVFCIIQQIAFYLHISFIYDLRWLIPNQLRPATFYRAPGIFTEPSFCAIMLLPAAYISTYYFIGKNNLHIKKMISFWKAIVNIIGVVCTFSTMGIVGIGVILVVIWFEYKPSVKQLIVPVLAIIFLYVVYTNVYEFKFRVDETLRLFSGQISLEKSNLSTQTLFLNTNITFDSLKNTLFMGGGLGSHLITYEKYINNYSLLGVYSLLNKADANSLGLRILSEIGVVGMIGCIVFYVKNRVGRINSIYAITSRMCLVYLIIRFIRYGHYFNLGIFFFIVVFIVSKKRQIKKG